MLSPSPAYVQQGWLTTVSDITANLLSNCLTQLGGNRFQADSGNLVHAIQHLAIPAVDGDSVQVDVVNQTVTLSIEPPEPTQLESSASSIGRMMGLTLTSEQIRTFPHDFTFAIIAGTTDKQLNSIFQNMQDGMDKLTPDWIEYTQSLLLVLEFATTRSNTPRGVRRAFDIKVDKYEYPIRSRIEAEGARFGQLACSLAVMSVSDTHAIMPSFLPHRDSSILANELCSRFRFATSVVRRAIAGGLNLQDTTLEQTRSDLKSMIKGIKPVWHQHDDPSFRVPMSRERVLTNDVSEESAMTGAMTSYIHTLKQNVVPTVMSLNSRQQRDGTVEDKYSYQSLRAQYTATCVGTRLDQKEILQMPNALPRLATNWRPFPIEGGNLHEQFIDSVIRADADRDWDGEPDIEKLYRLSQMLDTAPEYMEERSKRRMYKRVIVSLSEEQKVNFAMDGVLAKSMKDHPDVKEVRELKSQAFSINCGTEDIGQLLNETESMEQAGTDLTDSQMSIASLVANTLNDNETNHMSQAQSVLTLLSSKLGRWTSLVATIAQELSVSIKQNVKSSEWIYKKLLEYDCFLIVKPTRSSSHIFYRLIFPSNTESILPAGVARSLAKNAMYSYSPWLSVTVEKLTNQIKLESFLITMMAQWSRYYGLTLDEGLKEMRVWRMVKLCLLVEAEDRPRTEEILTLFRYVSMEKFTVLEPKNDKMLDKLPGVLHSRLQVWAVERLILAMSMEDYVPHKSERGEDEQVVAEGDGGPVRLTTDYKPVQEWRNLKNPYTLEDVADPAKLIELYYIGYSTNKEAKGWQNIEFDLVKKIVQYEDKLAEVRPEYCGMTEAPNNNFRFFEWSRKTVCAMGDSFKNLMRKTYGADQWEGRLEEAILIRFAKATWESLATLKASSVFDPADNKSGFVATGQKSGKRYVLHREKVAMRILDEMGRMKDIPLSNLSSLIEMVEMEGGLVVDIFRKPQHGGLREIYVLEIKSRLVQFAIEELSRALCNELPNEAMMHPHMKIQKPQEHMYHAATSKADYKMNISSSNDAQVWNQCHLMPKFAQFLCRILDPMWHGLIVNTLKLWMTKKIRLPDGVLNTLLVHPYLKTWDPVHQRIADAYLGKEDTSWLKKGRQWLQIESGMMQGILHYMSSLFHGAFLLLRDNLWKLTAGSALIRNTTTDLCSSDDSCRMTDVFCSSLDEMKRAVILTTVDHNSIDKLSALVGVKLSKKSLKAATGNVEFNSEFFFKASLVRPMIKFVFASLQLPVSESNMERFELYYSLIEQVLGGGSGFQVAHVCQIAQAYLHYRMLGASINPLFSRFSAQLERVKDPALGFMVLDPPIVAGLPGAQYGIWNLATKSETFNRISKSLILDRDRTSTSSGTITKGIQIRFGDRTKVKKLIDRTDVMVPSWLEKINENPEILYRASANKEEAKLKIAVKLTSPGVISSMARGNELSNMMASCVYQISGLATTIGQNWTDALKDPSLMTAARSKVSLMRLAVNAPVKGDKLTDDDLLILFPQKNIYQKFRSSLKQYEDYTLVNFGSRKTHRSDVCVFSQADSLLYSLESMVKYHWFDGQLDGSQDTIASVWARYKELHPWLMDDPISTLSHELCPFTTHIQLHNYITKRQGKSRVVHLTGTPVRDMSMRDVVTTAILKNQIPGRELINGTGYRATAYNKTAGTLAGVARILDFPGESKVKLVELKDFLRASENLWDGEDVRPGDKVVKLGVMQQFVKRGGPMLSPEDAQHMMLMARKARLGVIGGFTVRQRFNAATGRHYGRGVWSGRVDGVPLEISMVDNQLVKLVGPDMESIRSITRSILSLLREFNISDTVQHRLTPHVFTIKGLELMGTGASVYVKADLRFSPEPDPRTWSLDVVGNKLVLSTEQPSPDSRRSWRGSSIVTSLLTHTVGLRDSNLASPTIVPRNALIRHWFENKPLPHRISTFLLQDARGHTDTVDVESPEWLNFVSGSLMQSLRRAGFRFSVVEQFAPQLTDPGVDDEQLARFMDEFNLSNIAENLQNFDFLETESVIPTDSIKSLLDNVVQVDYSDVMEMDFKIPDHRGRINKAIVTSQLWDTWASHWFSTLSQRDLISFSMRRSTPATADLCNIISKYTPLSFSNGVALEEEEVEESWENALRGYRRSSD